jgi:hypothetical protein
VTRELLIVALIHLRKGERYSLPYDLLASVFPPGIDDDDAKVSALEFARAHDCAIDHQPHLGLVDFVRQ